MPLEATMMIVDNSEYMRNGDYPPTRFDAQADAVNAVFNAKIDSNPENTVGIMTMAGNGPEVLVTHTKELGQILQAVHRTSSKIGGAADIQTSIGIAQLALKHRQNKNLRQRIILFLGSPLAESGTDEKALVRLAKKLKKNNVSVDVIAFGDGIEERDTSVLRAFVDAANSGDNSHFLTVPPGTELLSDSILRSPILAGDMGIPEELSGGGAGPSGPAAGGQNFEFGVDPSIDPELAMALRMSMEEEQARQAAAAAANPAAAPSAPAPSSGAAAATAGAAAAATGAAAASATAPAPPTDDEEDALLQQALAISKGEDVEMGEGEEGDDEDMDEDEAIARAIAMSMEEGQPQGEPEKKS